jgi:hypothetical protein
MAMQHTPFHVPLGLAFAALALAGAAGCNCDPASTDVAPECPSGTTASSTITIQAALDGIRPVGADKQIRVRGTRASTASLCFTPGDQLSFSEIIEGRGNETVVVTPLGFGPWELQVTPLSGGDHPMIPPLNRNLAGGAGHTLTISPTAEGDIAVNFSP